MFYDSKSFKALETSISAMALKQKVIQHNLANVETPGYKSRSVEFRNVLSEESDRYDFKATVYTQNNTSSRPDGNNVDADVESMMLYQNYVQQVAAYQKISGSFTNFRYVLNQSAK